MDEYKVFIADGARSAEVSLNRWAEKGFSLQEIVVIDGKPTYIMVKWERPEASEEEESE